MGKLIYKVTTSRIAWFSVSQPLPIYEIRGTYHSGVYSISRFGNIGTVSAKILWIGAEYSRLQKGSDFLGAWRLQKKPNLINLKLTTYRLTIKPLVGLDII